MGEIDAADHRKTEQVLWSLARGTAPDAGENVYQALARQMAVTFGVDYACVVKHLDHPVTRVRTLGFWRKDRFGDDLEYEVDSTPCRETVTGASAFFPKDVQRLFPEDHFLVDLGVESYCGVPLQNSAGELIGHLALLDTKAITANPCEMPEFRIFAGRAAAELERQEIAGHLQQLQNQLEHICRVATAGELASGLAHEINQPLGAITNNAQACLRGLRNGTLDRDDLCAALEEINDDAFRAGQIIRNLRDFISRRPARQSTVEINPLVRDVATLLGSATAAAGIRLQLELAEDLPPVRVDRIQIQQVLVNLLNNAFEAGEDSQERPRTIIIKTSDAPEGVTVRVVDCGKGLAEDRIEPSFEPYVTTRPEGLGMGLAICRRIVEWHGGRVFARRNTGRGMTFGFTLPAQHAASSP